jgi:hypothetical protein
MTACVVVLEQECPFAVVASMSSSSSSSSTATTTTRRRTQPFRLLPMRMMMMLLLLLVRMNRSTPCTEALLSMDHATTRSTSRTRLGCTTSTNLSTLEPTAADIAFDEWCDANGIVRVGVRTVTTPLSLGGRGLFAIHSLTRGSVVALETFENRLPRLL